MVEISGDLDVMHLMDLKTMKSAIDLILKPQVVPKKKTATEYLQHVNMMAPIPAKIMAKLTKLILKHQAAPAKKRRGKNNATVHWSKKMRRYIRRRIQQ
jgi:hypothetical protein